MHITIIINSTLLVKPPFPLLLSIMIKESYHILTARSTKSVVTNPPSILKGLALRGHVLSHMPTHIRLHSEDG